MKPIFLFLFALLNLNAIGQELPPVVQEQLEAQVATESPAPEDESWVEEMEEFRKHPVSLNSADETTLKRLLFLNEIQVNNLLSYRKLLGKLISVYELQAVPGWDLSTILKLLPYISLDEAIPVIDQFRSRLFNGSHSLVARFTLVPEKAAGYIDSINGFKGSALHLFFRYRYKYKNLLQYGITADKDAGEQMFGGPQKMGFDFYSFHLFVTRLRTIRALVIGDYTVNMGQGLIQWQGFAMGKTGEVIKIKREAPLIQPYTSSGEYGFMRGMALTIGKKKWSLTGFASARKLSANLALDSITGLQQVTSIVTSGYHRTEKENEQRNRLLQQSYGGSLSYNNHSINASLNLVNVRYSIPIEKAGKPYNLYAMSGREWYNASMSNSFTYKNFHFFSELALDRHLEFAALTGLMISVDPKVDMAILYRNLPAGYQSINGNAFTESTYPTNEKGLYLAISIRQLNNWRIDVYADYFQFPWLRYQLDQPSNGNEYMLQLGYTPDKRTTVTTRWRFRSKEEHSEEETIHVSANTYRMNWRTQIERKLNNALTIRCRAEIIYYKKKPGSGEVGALFYTDMLYHPLARPYSFSFRYQYFETGGNEAAIYAYENDVLYRFSIPGFSGRGTRFYGNISVDLNRKLSCWLRFARTVQADSNHIGSGNDMIHADHRSEISVQIRFVL